MWGGVVSGNLVQWRKGRKREKDVRGGGRSDAETAGERRGRDARGVDEDLDFHRAL